MPRSETTGSALASPRDRLLRRCRPVHILCTSREALRVGGEALLRVPPLAVDGAPARSDAVRLFAERAAAAVPGFVLTEDIEGVKAFARGCMRTYDLMKERAKKWNADPEIKAILADLAKSDEPDWAGNKYSPDKGKALKAKTYDRVALGARGLNYERLDQLTIEILMVAR